MKLCAHVLTPETAVVPGMLAYCGPFNTVLPRLAQLGYRGVELITVDPSALTLSELDAVFRAHGLEVAAVNTGRLCGELGLTLSDPDPDVRQRAIQYTCAIIDFAAHWGVPVNVGILRGRYRQELPPSETERLTAEGLRKLCRHGEKRGVDLAIETVCFLQTNYIHTLEEAAALVRAVGSPRLGVMYDLFQMNIEERDLLGSIRRYMPLCKHVHFADSNRLAPGQGNMDYPALIACLRQAGYDGPVSVELRPEPSQDEAAKAAAEYLLPLLSIVDKSSNESNG